MPTILFNIFALVMLFIALVLFEQIQIGSTDAILHDQECREILGVEIWYHPNGGIAGVKF